MPRQKSKPTSAQGFDQAWKKFHSDNFGADEVPLGWISAYKYADLNGISASSANNLLRRAVQAGAATTQNFRVRSETGTRVITHFKLK